MIRTPPSFRPARHYGSFLLVGVRSACAHDLPVCALHLHSAS